MLDRVNAKLEIFEEIRFEPFSETGESFAWGVWATQVSVLLQGRAHNCYWLTWDWAGYQADLFAFTQVNPELGFLMVVIGNAITNPYDWSAT